jgi:hypothetical protein
MNPPIRMAVRLLCAALGAGTLAMIVANQSTLGRMRPENEALLRDQAEVARLTAENGQLAELRAENEAVQKLRLENHDLPRLRNEIHRWREDAAEAAKLRAEKQLSGAARAAGTTAANTAAATVPADFILRANLVDAGFSTPEAALQTFFHALSQGDIVRAMQCGANAQSHPMTEEQQDTQRTQMLKEFGSFPGFRIAGTETLSADEVQLGIQSVPGGVIAPIKLKLVGGEWKIKE